MQVGMCRWRFCPHHLQEKEENPPSLRRSPLYSGLLHMGLYRPGMAVDGWGSRRCTTETGGASGSPRKETSSEPRPQRLHRPRRLWTQRRGQRRWGLLSDTSTSTQPALVLCKPGLLACVNARASGATKARHSDQCHQVTESSDGDESLSTQCMAASRKHTLTDSRMQCSRRPSPRLEAVH